jgi:hypothetical protein
LASQKDIGNQANGEVAQGCVIHDMNAKLFAQQHSKVVS